MPTRRKFLAWTAALPAACLAGAPLTAAPRVFSPVGLAIRGADPVAYFDGHGAVAGSALHAVEWNGAVWFFSSARNRERFESDPRGHAPQYGGYCAYGVSRGALLATDPHAWTIWDGRLFLKRSKAVRDVWRQDIAGHVARANENWPGLVPS